MAMSQMGPVLPVDVLTGSTPGAPQLRSSQEVEQAFDRLFLELMWQGAAAANEVSADDASPHGSMWDGFISTAMVTALSESGSLGLGRALVAQLESYGSLGSD